MRSMSRYRYVHINNGIIRSSNLYAHAQTRAKEVNFPKSCASEKKSRESSNYSIQIMKKIILLRRENSGIIIYRLISGSSLAHFLSRRARRPRVASIRDVRLYIITALDARWKHAYTYARWEREREGELLRRGCVKGDNDTRMKNRITLVHACAFTL